MTFGSTSNSPTSSIGSNTGKRMMHPGRPKRSESDSGHNSSSNCDSNSTSSVGSAGSPTSAKVRQRLSSMRQYGRPFGQTNDALQHSKSIFYINSTADLSQSLKIAQSTGKDISPVKGNMHINAHTCTDTRVHMQCLSFF